MRPSGGGSFAHSVHPQRRRGLFLFSDDSLADSLPQLAPIPTGCRWIARARSASQRRTYRFLRDKSPLEAA